MFERKVLVAKLSAALAILVGISWVGLRSGGGMIIPAGALAIFAIILWVFYSVSHEFAADKRNEQTLLESEARYRAVSELTSDYTYAFRVQPDGLVVVEWIGGAFTRITGYTAEEVEARGGGITLVHPDDVSSALRRVQTLVSGQPDTSEFRIITKSGEVRWVRENARPVREAQGTVRIFGAAQDITERKRAEDEARQRQAELAHLLRLSTIGEMAASLAHEINQPLSAIVSYAKGCARRLQAGVGEPSQLLDPLEQIAAQAVRADQIVRRLRTFVSKEEPRRERVDVDDLMREVKELVDAEARQQGVTLNWVLAPGLPPVRVDRVQIEQVMLNLVRNSFEALDGSDSPQRVLQIQTSMAGSDTIEFAVTDAGKGIAATIAGKIFDPFFTTKADGLGMGLSISRSIIEAHGGRLWATSNPGWGTTVRFTVPRASDGAADAT